MRQQVKRFLSTIIAIIGFILAVSVVSIAQDVTPKRGFQVGGSFSVSDIETINNTNGNLMLHFPLAKLPPGRGGLSASINLIYNGKLQDQVASYFTDASDNWVSQNFLVNNEDGGWQYGFNYTVELINRFTNIEFSSGICGRHQVREESVVFWVNGDFYQQYAWKVRIRMPDGSSRDFAPQGATDYYRDGFYNVHPDGTVETCAGPTASNNTTTFYSKDGTHMRLDFPHTPNGDYLNNWTLSMPDGTRVINVAGQPQTITDRNNNSIQIQSVTNYNNTGHPATKLVDDEGRSVAIEYAGQQDFIHQVGFNNETLTWTVKWKTIYPYKTYITTGTGNNPDGGCPKCKGGSSTQIFQDQYNVVDQIILPSQSGGLAYVFGYNAPTIDSSPTSSLGWGEVNSIIMPACTQVSSPSTCASVNYQYFYDGDPPLIPTTTKVLRNYAKTKNLNYLTEYDGATAPVTETTTYLLSNISNTITAPDGGVTTIAFGDTTSQDPDSGLVFSTTHPDGSCDSSIWQHNYPVVGSAGVAANPFVKTQFHSITDGFGNLTSTAIKNYTYDKNGNVTQVTEYDWVNYALAFPTGAPAQIPGTASVKRVTVNTYYNPTPDSSDSTTDSPNAYSNQGSPMLRNAIKSSEVQSDIATLARNEIFYDDPSTTGNVIQQVSWDSSKGALTNPLNASNSVSVVHQYNAFGSPTLSTDALGNQTKLTYGTVNGLADLYVTKSQAAYGTSVERDTGYQYDFNTGLVTMTSDLDNRDASGNPISKQTTYDAFGRPILVQEALGVSGLEKQTAMTYDDIGRKVITSSDLNTTGDHLLVKVIHYDQMWRPRLTRHLEDATTQSASDETAGIKVQTRYLSAAGFAYILMSNPYRAGSSTAAASESTMGWTRTKSDTLDRIVETQTFGGPSLPGPAPQWGTNSNSTGITTIGYAGSTTTVTNQAGKVRSSIVDGLGRLRQVNEDPGGLNYQTTYGYDAMGNLLTVTQQGNPAQQGTQQTRTFIYDSLKRLQYARNPEVSATINGTGNGAGAQWSVAYLYDETGNLLVKTDARGVSTHYSYDNLGRLIHRWYNGSIDPGTTSTSQNTPPLPAAVALPAEANYFYDGATSAMHPPSTLADPSKNSKGRLTAAITSDGQGSYFEYDALGQHSKSVQLTDSTYYAFSYSHNVSGSLTSQTYPSGRKVNTDYDVAGRSSRVSDQTGAGGGAQNYTTVAAAIGYAPNGGLLQQTLGNGLTHTLGYNSRAQTTNILVGGAAAGNVISLTYDYGSANNGDVQSLTITPGAGQPTMTQRFTYDGVDRLRDVNETIPDANSNPILQWQQSFKYDGFGNRWLDAAVDHNFPGPLTAQIDFDSTTNRIAKAGYQYDASGNLTTDGNQQYVYDAENHQVQATSTLGPIAQYVYDADGKRVKKKVGATSTVFVYDASGALAAEYDISSQPIPSSAGVVAPTYPVGQSQVWPQQDTNYGIRDTLESPRVWLDSSGQVVSRHDYAPFGEELFSGIGGRIVGQGYQAQAQVDGQKRQFTSKERDTETGLDYFGARYYSSATARWTSVDPRQDVDRNINEPQAWNLYNYCINKPLTRMDPDGRQDDSRRAFELALYKKGVSQKEREEAMAAYDKAYQESFEKGMTASVAVAATLALGPEAGAMIWGWVLRNPATVQQTGQLMVQASQGNPMDSPSSITIGLEIATITRLTKAEVSTGTRLASQNGLHIKESEHLGEEFVELTTGKTYDALGKPNAYKYWNEGQFLNSIKGHVNKSVDYIAIDLKGASYEQVKTIKNYVSTLTEAQQAKVLYVY